MSATAVKQTQDYWYRLLRSCSRCGFRYRPKEGTKVVLCQSCREAMTPSQKKKWLSS